MFAGTAPVDRQGSRLFFVDSGPINSIVEGRPYTTVVILHGAGFNGCKFEHCFPNLSRMVIDDVSRCRHIPKNMFLGVCFGRTPYHCQPARLPGIDKARRE
jgi:hypothetical protein